MRVTIGVNPHDETRNGSTRRPIADGFTFNGTGWSGSCGEFPAGFTLYFRRVDGDASYLLSIRMDEEEMTRLAQFAARTVAAHTKGAL